MTTIKTFMGQNRKLLMLSCIAIIVGLGIWGVTAALTPNDVGNSTMLAAAPYGSEPKKATPDGMTTCGDFLAELGRKTTISEKNPIHAMIKKDDVMTRLDMARIVGTVLELSTAQVVDMKDKSSIDEAGYKYASDMVVRAIIPLIDGKFEPTKQVTVKEQNDVIASLLEMKYLSDEKIAVFAGTAFKGKTNGEKLKSDLSAPIGITFDDKNQMVVSDNTSNSLRQIKSNEMTQLSPATAPRYVAALNDGTFIYSAENSIFRQDGSEIASGFNSPSEIVVINKANDFYVADTKNNCIKLVRMDGTVKVVAGVESKTGGFVDGEKAKFNYPTGLALGVDGTLYISDSGNQRIRTLVKGVVTTIAGGGDEVESETGFMSGGYTDGAAASARFNFPSGIDIAEDGVLFISDTGNNVIRAITTNGTVTTVAGSGEAGNKIDMLRNSMFNKPRDVKYHDGSLYIADTNNNQIKVVSLDTTTIPKTVAVKNTEPNFNKKPEEIAEARTVTLFDFTGKVTVTTLGDCEIVGYKGMRLNQGDRVTTDEGTIAQLDIDGNKVLTLNGSTVIELSMVSGDKKQQKTTISLLAGTIVNNVAKLGNNDYSVKTSKTTMGVRGTVFAVKLSDTDKGYYETSVVVLEGTVAAGIVGTANSNGMVSQSETSAAVEAMQVATFNADNTAVGSNIQDNVITDTAAVQQYIDNSISTDTLNAIVTAMKAQSNTSPDLLKLVTTLNSVVQRVEEIRAGTEVPPPAEPPKTGSEKAEDTSQNDTGSKNNYTETGTNNGAGGNQPTPSYPNTSSDRTPSRPSSKQTTSNPPSVSNGGASTSVPDVKPPKPPSGSSSESSSSAPSSTPSQPPTSSSDTKPPLQVTKGSIIATKTNSGIEIFWDEVRGATGYKVVFTFDDNASIPLVVPKEEVQLNINWTKTCRVSITPLVGIISQVETEINYVISQFPNVTSMTNVKTDNPQKPTEVSIKFYVGEGRYSAAVFKKNSSNRDNNSIGSNPDTTVTGSNGYVEIKFDSNLDVGNYYLNIFRRGGNDENCLTRYDFKNVGGSLSPMWIQP